MKRIFALALSAAMITPTVYATDVGVSVEISQPGVFGRVDIGRFPQPAVVLPQPVIVEAPRVVHVQPQPVYLWVPPGHRKNWRKHCRDYNACGVPVYFVRHDWYDQHVRHARIDHDRDDDDRGRGRPQYRGGEYKEKYHDGACKVEREWKRDGSYKEERECQAARGDRRGRRSGDYEEKYREGPCEVEREWKRDGTYKEKLDCKG
jgi:hypothetical protein